MPTQWTHGPPVRIFFGKLSSDSGLPLLRRRVNHFGALFQSFLAKTVTATDLFSGDLTPHHRNCLAKTDLLKKLHFW